MQFRLHIIPLSTTVHEFFLDFHQFLFVRKIEYLLGFIFKTRYSRSTTSNSVKSYLKYFEESFVRARTSGESSYPVEFWSTHDRKLKDVPRTTNNLEAWHRKINQINTMAHPNSARFIEVIKSEEQITKIHST